MVNPTNNVHKIKNRVDKNKVLSAKSPAVSKINKVMRKHPFRFNLSGYLLGKSTITQIITQNALAPILV